MYYVYILKCADGSLYTGITNDLDKRMATHKAGEGSKYVRAHMPFKLVYKEEHPNKISAAKREWEVKHFGKEKKIQLILSNK